MNPKSETVAEIPDLETALGQLHDAVSRHSRGRLETIQAALDGGSALAALRQRAQHGDWGRWIADAGLTERTAHNWRRLAGLGLSAEQVAAQGGIRAVLEANRATRPEDDVEAAATALERLECAMQLEMLDARMRKHITTGKATLEKQRELYELHCSDERPLTTADYEEAYRWLPKWQSEWTLMLVEYEKLMGVKLPASYPVHGLCRIFPNMRPHEFALLKESLARDGFDEWHPIALWHGEVLDGKERLRACEEMGIKPLFEELPDDTDPYAFVTAANMARQNLTDDQIAMSVALVKQYQTSPQERKGAGTSADGRGL